MDIHRIQKLIAYIEANSHRKISPEELEDVSHYSYRNIQRVFLALTKETIGRCITRIRLENAYKLLIYSDLPITEIALNVGFESNQSFAKAFKQKFGITPLNARENKAEVFIPYIASHQIESKDITFDYVYMSPLAVYYNVYITNDYNTDAINTIWQQVDNYIPSTTDTMLFGIIIDQPLISDKTRTRYEACMTKVTDTKPFLKKTIFGQWYARYTHPDNHTPIEDTYRNIYYQWMNAPSYTIDATPIIEQYLPNETVSDTWATHILIPVEKKLVNLEQSNIADSK